MGSKPTRPIDKDKSEFLQDVEMIKKELNNLIDMNITMFSMDFDKIKVCQYYEKTIFRYGKYNFLANRVGNETIMIMPLFYQYTHLKAGTIEILNAYGCFIKEADTSITYYPRETEYMFKDFYQEPRTITFKMVSWKQGFDDDEEVQINNIHTTDHKYPKLYETLNIIDNKVNEILSNNINNHIPIPGITRLITYYYV